MSTPKAVASISAFSLLFLITGAVDSIRNLPTTALFGSSLIFFFCLSAVIFLLPVALVSAELASAHSEESGIYQWTTAAFGEHIGFIAIWLQWINTMVWFPTILSFIVSTAAYLIDPQLTQNKFYLVSAILFVFWSLTILHLKGLHTSAIFADICAIIGIFIPMGLIITLGLIWVIQGNPIHIQFTKTSLIPSFHSSGHWVALTAIMTSFLGIELSTVHVKDVENPKKNFPRIMLASAALIFFTMIFGSLAIAFILPINQIHLVDGIMQAFTLFFDAYHISWIMPIITIMLLIGGLGGMTSWIISPARGLLQAAQHGYLPKLLTHRNQAGVPQNLLLCQAILVSLICLAFSLMPSVSGAYWLLSALSTELYIIMYVIMFFAAIKIKKQTKNHELSFTIPGKQIGHLFICILGLIGCFTTLVVGFIPPTGIEVGSTLQYDLTFLSGIIIMLLPIGIFYWFATSHNKRNLLK